MTNKSSLKRTMLALGEEKLAYSEREYAAYLGGSLRERSEPAEHGQSSQDFGSAEIAQSFEGPIHTYIEALDEIRRIDFGAKSEVGEGAAVRFNGRWYVVAASTVAFECDGVTYMGISKQAPIYAAIEGKSKGQTFTFGGRTIEIEEVC